MRSFPTLAVFGSRCRIRTLMIPCAVSSLSQPSKTSCRAANSGATGGTRKIRDVEATLGGADNGQRLTTTICALV